MRYSERPLYSREGFESSGASNVTVTVLPCKLLQHGRLDDCILTCLKPVHSIFSPIRARSEKYRAVRHQDCHGKCGDPRQLCGSSYPVDHHLLTFDVVIWVFGNNPSLQHSSLKHLSYLLACLYKEITVLESFTNTMYLG